MRRTITRTLSLSTSATRVAEKDFAHRQYGAVRYRFRSSAGDYLTRVVAFRARRMILGPVISSPHYSMDATNLKVYEGETLEDDVAVAEAPEAIEDVDAEEVKRTLEKAIKESADRAKEMSTPMAA